MVKFVLAYHWSFYCMTSCFERHFMLSLEVLQNFNEKSLLMVWNNWAFFIIFYNHNLICKLLQTSSNACSNPPNSSTPPNYNYPSTDPPPNSSAPTHHPTACGGDPAPNSASPPCCGDNITPPASTSTSYWSCSATKSSSPTTQAYYKT